MRHLVFTLKGCQYHLLDDEAYIRTTLVNAAVMAQATLLGITSHKFDPQGVTAVALLAESHISIHTWPEKLMAVCDVFTCGDRTMPESAMHYMYENFCAQDITAGKILRDDEVIEPLE